MIFSLVFLFLLFPSSPFSLAYSFFSSLLLFTRLFFPFFAFFLFFLFICLYLFSFSFLSLFFLIFPSFSLSLFFFAFPFVSSFGRVRSFHCFSPVVSAAVFRGTVPDAPVSLNQFDFELFAVKLKQMTVMFPFAHASYLHVVNHVPGNPGFGRHRF